jgi:hypothetical protein
MQLTKLRSFAGYVLSQYDVVRERKVLEGRTGAAKTSVPNKKEKEIYASLYP